MKNTSDCIKIKIKELMKAHHLTAYSLSKAADLTQTCIANWYSSRNYTPSIIALEKVCDVLGITLAGLFCNENEEMIPVDDEFKAVFNNWQKLTQTQKEAIKIHIASYLKK